MPTSLETLQDGLKQMDDRTDGWMDGWMDDLSPPPSSSPPPPPPPPSSPCPALPTLPPPSSEKHSQDSLPMYVTSSEKPGGATDCTLDGQETQGSEDVCSYIVVCPDMCESGGLTCERGVSKEDILNKLASVSPDIQAGTAPDDVYLQIFVDGEWSTVPDSSFDDLIAKARPDKVKVVIDPARKGWWRRSGLASPGDIAAFLALSTFMYLVSIKMMELSVMERTRVEWHKLDETRYGTLWRTVIVLAIGSSQWALSRCIMSIWGRSSILPSILKAKTMVIIWRTLLICVVIQVFLILPSHGTESEEIASEATEGLRGGSLSWSWDKFYLNLRAQLWLYSTQIVWGCLEHRFSSTR